MTLLRTLFLILALIVSQTAMMATVGGVPAAASVSGSDRHMGHTSAEMEHGEATPAMPCCVDMSDLSSHGAGGCVFCVMMLSSDIAQPDGRVKQVVLPTVKLFRSRQSAQLLRPPIS
ncbi:hypothetical protein [Coralliovum pocilloporae]|uniref:hypothetical protein n=1 Tax=Coralliovum pocilloporae TaxID=3066369 RepID=UPI003306A0BA